MISPIDAFIKRAFDIVFSAFGLMLVGGVILLAFLAATVDTGRNGFFLQERVGRLGRPFKVIKIRTMRDQPQSDVKVNETTVTTAADPRITRLGRFFRRFKIDELPQLVNVLIGQMSFVGPRPDVYGFADQLSAGDRDLLLVRPGITGPATLKYRDEERQLAEQADPESYNREIIFPDKVRINLEYVRNYRIRDDVRYILLTLFG